MTALTIGMILFGGIHLFSIFLPAVRDGFEAKLGEKRWKGLYALVSLAGIVFLIVGYWQSRSGPLAADWLMFPPPGRATPTWLSWPQLSSCSPHRTVRAT